MAGWFLKVFYAFHYLECEWLLKVDAQDAHRRKTRGICNLYLIYHRLLESKQCDSADFAKLHCHLSIAGRQEAL